MSLLAEERKKRIIAALQRTGQVRVVELAEQLAVSTETVRRYLEELEHDQKLKKVHGGAVALEKAPEEPSWLEREVANQEAKARIAAKALEYVYDGDILFIDEGSTPLQMIGGLAAKRGLTVITNSFPVTAELMALTNRGEFDGDVIFTGGAVNARHFRCDGNLSERMAAMFSADKAFLSADAIRCEKGVLCFDLQKAALTQLFIDNATTSFLLVDRSKVNANAPYRMAEWCDIDYVISDGEVPEGWNFETTQWLNSET